MTLPIEDITDALIDTLTQATRAVLQAPPGAGKTTYVPLALLKSGQFSGKILILEPRRLATKAAAMRMAQLLSESLGQTVGYRMRGESKTSAETRIEVVTEGILTAMIQSDPELTGIGTIIFDEFHERSLQADLGLALAWEVKSALREDLNILVMSATLDAAPVAKMLDNAPILTSAGKSFPVDVIWRDRPAPDSSKLETQLLPLIEQALEETTGTCLTFLPGVGEIRRLKLALKGRTGLLVQPLHGSLKDKEQKEALAVTPKGLRKVVLASAIAETSLTLPDVGSVVDSGLARRARFDPSRGMSRLVTERVTKAEATQRAGRAGRLRAGKAYRNWTKGAEGGLQPFPPAEIESADLTSLALDLCLWGDPFAKNLAFLSMPKCKALEQAHALLQAMGALEGTSCTPHGTALSKLPLHPRLGHMLLKGGKGSSLLAALIESRSLPLSQDLEEELKQVHKGGHPKSSALKKDAKRLVKFEAEHNQYTPAQQVALAYPDRIALRRTCDAPRYHLSSGAGARLEKGDPLIKSPLLVATDLDGDRREARIRQGVALSHEDLAQLFEDQFEWVKTCAWDSRTQRVTPQECLKFKALTLENRTWSDAPSSAIARACLVGVRQLGINCLNWTPKAQRFRKRVQAADLANLSDQALLNTLEDWLLPYLGAVNSAEGLKRFDPLEALQNHVGWENMATLERLAPEHYCTPLGRKVPISYDGDLAEVALRMQEVFGETRHPKVGANQVPLRMVLLSPGHKPLQVTQDLPGFWRGSYEDVRKEMRGRYPKHPWPEDPSQALPTERAKKKPQK